MTDRIIRALAAWRAQLPILNSNQDVMLQLRFFVCQFFFSSGEKDYAYLHVVEYAL